VFTTTVVHELGHAVYEELLTDGQRELLLGDYVAFLDKLPRPPANEPTTDGVQHHLIALLLAATLGYGTLFVSVARARSSLNALGVAVG